MYDEAARDLGGEDCLYVGLTGSGRGAVAEVGRERGVCGARGFVCAAHRLGGEGDQMILIEHTRLNLSRSCQQGHSTAYNTPCTFSRLQRILLLRTLS